MWIEANSATRTQKVGNIMRFDLNVNFAASGVNAKLDFTTVWAQKERRFVHHTGQNPGTKTQRMPTLTPTNNKGTCQHTLSTFGGGVRETERSKPQVEENQMWFLQKGTVLFGTRSQEPFGDGGKKCFSDGCFKAWFVWLSSSKCRVLKGAR